MIESLISAAIEDQRLIRLQYEGRSKTVNPHRLGYTEKNVEALLCWQTDLRRPGEPKWQLLELRKIYGLLVLDQKFAAPPRGHHPPEDMALAVEATL